MKKNCSIPFSEIESIPVLIKDFLGQNIQGFEAYVFSEQNIHRQFLEKEKTYDDASRGILSDVLKDQYSGYDLSQKQERNLDELRHNAFTVTTGHQLNLFTGPVFFIYKILQTVKLAEHLNDCFPERKTVPIFWMATEDHDFEEINHFKTENNYYETTTKSGGAVGQIQITDDRFISEFEDEFKDSVFGTELILMMKRAYKKGLSLAQATRIVVHELFSDYGLIVLDGDDVRLKRQMKKVFEEELSMNSLSESTRQTVELLSEKYKKVQVNPREINLFYLTETRDRIEFDGTEFIVVDKNIRFSKVEILEELEQHPERFSPNALMRPVYQELLLPNLAYIGGNAEIMYWLELKDYFTHLSVPFPVLIPRNSLLFLQQKTLDKTEKLGLGIKDFFKNFATVTKDIMLEDNEILALLDEREQSLSAQFDLLSATAGLTDASFGTLVAAEKARQLKSFGRLRKRLLRAEKKKQAEKLERMENLFLKIHPGKSWQERVLNFSVFYADHGREWLQSCYEEMSVADAEMIVVSI